MSLSQIVNFETIKGYIINYLLINKKHRIKPIFQLFVKLLRGKLISKIVESP